MRRRTRLQRCKPKPNIPIFCKPSTQRLYLLRPSPLRSPFRLAAFALLLLLLLASCDTADDAGTDPSGAIYLTVRKPSGTGVAIGATVTTTPPLGTFRTSNLGTLRIDDVPEGLYTVLVVDSTIGSAETALQVRRDELAEATLSLQPGVFTSYPPALRIVAPYQYGNEGYSRGERVAFEARVSDPDTPLHQVTITWTSSRDGLLTEIAGVARNGTTTLTTQSLSFGRHTVYAIATDADGNRGIDSVSVPVLAPPTATQFTAVRSGGGVRLDWALSSTTVGRDELSELVVDRSLHEGTHNMGWTEIAQLPTFERSFVDDTIPITSQVSYRIRTLNTSGFSSMSDTLIVRSPVGSTFHAEIRDVASHPDHPFVYAIAQSYGSGTSARPHLLMIHLDSETMIRQVEIAYQPGFADLRDNGDGMRLYVAGTNDERIHVYDESLSEVSTIATGVPVASVTTNGAGVAFVGVRPSPWWNGPLRSYNLHTGEEIGRGGNHPGPRVRLSADGRQMIEITTDFSPPNMAYHEVGLDGTFVRSVEDSQHGSHPLHTAPFERSPDDRYVVTSNEGAVYTADAEMTYKGRLRDDGSLTSLAFGSGGALYAGSVDGWIREYSVATRTEARRYASRGVPRFIFRRGNTLYALSSAGSGVYPHEALTYVLERFSVVQ